MILKMKLQPDDRFTIRTNVVNACIYFTTESVHIEQALLNRVTRVSGLSKTIQNTMFAYQYIRVDISLNSTRYL